MLLFVPYISILISLSVLLVCLGSDNNELSFSRLCSQDFVWTFQSPNAEIQEKDSHLCGIKPCCGFDPRTAAPALLGSDTDSFTVEGSCLLTFKWSSSARDNIMRENEELA